MAKQKLYAGTKLRELRRKVDLTQREFSERLEVSLPYLNQMENNNRPVSAAVILALADVFGFDVTELVQATTRDWSAICAKRPLIRSLAPMHRIWPISAWPPTTLPDWRALLAAASGLSGNP